ncbi:MAG: hypothetical protein ACRCWB_11520 [Enterovibrio sp.]
MNGMKWDGTEPLGMSISQLLYRMRANDAKEGLLFDSITMHDILSGSDVELMAFDALTVPYGRLKKKMEQLQMVMSAASSELDVVAFQLSDKFKRGGALQTACVFELSDGQTVSVFLHNPDSTPSSISDSDVMISWKWMLNKKDVTIVVAPERGKDLPAKTVAVRLMKLAEKNSATFVKNNAKRAEKLSRIEELRAQVAELETTLKTKKARSNDLENEIIDRKVSKSTNGSRKGKGKGKTITELRTQGQRTAEEELVTITPEPEPVTQPEPEPIAQPEPTPESEPEPVTQPIPEEPVLITPTEITPQPEPEPIAQPEPVTQPEQAQPDDFEQWVSENFGGESMFELSKERDPSLEGDARLLLKVKKESIPTKYIAASDLWDNYYQAAIKRYKEDGALGKLSSESIDTVSGALLKTVTAEFDGFYN